MIIVWPLKWLTIKLVAPKGCSYRLDAVIGRTGLASHHLESLLGVIDLIVLCAFMCKVKYYDAQIRETLLYK